MNFTESIRDAQLAILKDNPTIVQQHRRKFLVDQCPYSDPVKVRAWKEMAKSLTAERPVKRTAAGDDPEMAAWKSRNQI